MPVRKRPLPSLTSAQLERFHSYISKTDTCWIWQGSLTAMGYASISINRKNYVATRISYMLHKGTDPGAQLVCHSCDNPLCVNPAHLWLGNELQNAIDALNKGIYPVGSRKKNALLTEEDVKCIKRLLDDGQIMRTIADQFKVSTSTINNIKHRTTWRHVTMPGFIDMHDENAIAHFSSRKIKRKKNKLEQSDVLRIRSLLEQDVSISAIAKQYGVTFQAIWLIKNRINWKRVA